MSNLSRSAWHAWPDYRGTRHPGTWVKVQDMTKKRCYPSVIAVDPPLSTMNARMMVSGGVDKDATGYAENSYQVWTKSTVAAGIWVSSGPGPTFNGAFKLDVYPCMHFLSTGEVATAGMLDGSSRIDLFATLPAWLQNTGWVHPPASPPTSGRARHYGSSVLFPISAGGTVKDYVLSIGGRHTAANVTGITNWVETSPHASQSAGGQYWLRQTTVPYLPGDLTYRRHFLNTVLLPDTSILVVGGEQDCFDFSMALNPALIPELYQPASQNWLPMAQGTIIRDYHSAAVLLPDGRVMTSGGDSRDFAKSLNCKPKGRQPLAGNPPYDYQIFQPIYIACQYYRPVVRNFALAQREFNWIHGQSASIVHDPLPFGVTISKVVLMRAGSVTHHSDGNQRCVELEFSVFPEPDPLPPGYLPTLQVTVPTLASHLLPRGYYMLFLATNMGGVSTPAATTAPWIKIEK